MAICSVYNYTCELLKIVECVTMNNENLSFTLFFSLYINFFITLEPLEKMCKIFQNYIAVIKQQFLHFFTQFNTQFYKLLFHSKDIIHNTIELNHQLSCFRNSKASIKRHNSIN